MRDHQSRPPITAVPAAADPGPDVLMTAGEVAALLGVPVSWVYEQSRAGRVPTVALGRYRRFRRQAIEAWVCDLERQGGRAIA
jgi:excisionase family DNA binding protein